MGRPMADPLPVNLVATHTKRCFRATSLACIRHGEFHTPILRATFRRIV